MGILGWTVGVRVLIQDKKKKILEPEQKISSTLSKNEKPGYQNFPYFLYPMETGKKRVLKKILEQNIVRDTENFLSSIS